MEYKFQIMINKGTNLWSFYDEQGFMYGAETIEEAAEKLEELADEYPMKDLMVVQVLDPQVIINLPDPCPTPPPVEPAPEEPPVEPVPPTTEPETPPETNPDDTDTV